MAEGTISFLVLGAVVVLFVWNKLPVEIVAIGAGLTLYATGVLELAISPRPVLMSVTVAAAASFLTPVATPANLMVMGPGGYRFGDYWKLGLLMLLWFLVISVFLVPQFWSF